eukprot:Amastigsp_a186860_25.p2 type:complete len:139 gc:universal Amastigsp_a186860_25:442-26(-)
MRTSQQRLSCGVFCGSTATKSRFLAFFLRRERTSPPSTGPGPGPAKSHARATWRRSCILLLALEAEARCPGAVCGTGKNTTQTRRRQRRSYRRREKRRRTYPGVSAQGQQCNAVRRWMTASKNGRRDAGKHDGRSVPR